MQAYQGTRRFGTPNAAPIDWITRSDRAAPAHDLSEVFAYHATTMANTMRVPLLVFSHTGRMPALLSHYRPDGQIFTFSDCDVVRRRLALYHAVTTFMWDFEGSQDDAIAGAMEVGRG